jgi:hypothetical protein
MRPVPRAIRAAGLGLATLIALGAAAGAQTRPSVLGLEDAPGSAVYADDSFFFRSFHTLDGLGGHVASLLRGAGSAQRFRTAPVSIGAARLVWHDPIGYALGRPASARAELAASPLGWRAFDIAILTDCGDCPAQPRAVAAHLERIHRDAETVRRQGGEPVLFMPWAPRDRPEAQQRIAEATTQAANAAGALVIPAGLAFARAEAERPAVELREDRQHPSHAGAYLAAVVTYAALYGASPIGNRFTAGLDAETAGFLQRVAWETVWEYYAGRPPAE